MVVWKCHGNLGTKPPPKKSWRVLQFAYMEKHTKNPEDFKSLTNAEDADTQLSIALRYSDLCGARHQWVRH